MNPETKNQKPSFLHKYVYLFIYQAPIVQTLDSAIQRLDNQGQKYNILSTEDSTRHFSTI